MTPQKRGRGRPRKSAPTPMEPGAVETESTEVSLHPYTSHASGKRKRDSVLVVVDEDSRKRRASNVTAVTSNSELEVSSQYSSDEDTKSQYRYKDLKPGYIRVLTLHPKLGANSDDATPDCSLSIRPHNKEKMGDYEALSYVWGGQPKTRDIHILSKKKGIRMLRVTENLMTALKHLRLKDQPRKFWIDAICINQDNKDELNGQVPLMSKIYSEAKNVCVWLGERDDTSSLAMKLLPKIRDLEDFEDIIDSKTTSEEWAALIKLMQKDWFRRRWVVQEIALARRASIYCGKDKLSWSEFSEAIALFQDGAALVNAKFKRDAAYRNEPDYVGNVSEYPASRLVAATSRVVRKSEDNDVMMKVRSLEYLVSTLTPFEATESADSIYAVLSLAQDVPGYSKVIAPTATIDTTTANGVTETDDRIEKGTREGNLVSKVVQRMKKIAQKYPVDYNKPFTAICTDFLEFVFRTSQSLDMICRPWAPKSETALPSWILTLWDETHVQHRKYMTMIRKKADILVGAPGQGVYSASGRYPAFHKITTKVEHGQTKTVLTVKGFILDEISKRDDAASAAVVPESWFEIGGWDRDRDEALPEAFWRTLVADRDHEGRNPPAWYPLACKHALGYFHNRMDAVDIMRVADRLDETVLKKFIQRLQAVIWGRRLARTKRDKFLSLVPSKAVEKDLVCIVAGISVPVILRQRTMGPGFEFIGEAYVHGMMDGEAFEVRRRLELEWEELELY